MTGFLVGVDIGGTFTDCVVVSPDGAVTTAKAPSTPPDFSSGFVAALELATGKLGDTWIRTTRRWALFSCWACSSRCSRVITISTTTMITLFQPLRLNLNMASLPLKRQCTEFHP